VPKPSPLPHFTRTSWARGDTSTSYWPSIVLCICLSPHVPALRAEFAWSRWQVELSARASLPVNGVTARLFVAGSLLIGIFYLDTEQFFASLAAATIKTCAEL
jgi:hypothetical protein